MLSDLDDKLIFFCLVMCVHSDGRGGTYIVKQVVQVTSIEKVCMRRRDVFLCYLECKFLKRLGILILKSKHL